MARAMLETWVVGELLKSWWRNGLCAPFHFRGMPGGPGAVVSQAPPLTETVWTVPAGGI